MTGPKQRAIAAFLILIALLALILLVGASNPVIGTVLAVMLASVIQTVGPVLLIATLALVAVVALTAAALFFRAAHKGQGFLQVLRSIFQKSDSKIGFVSVGDLILKVSNVNTERLDKGSDHRAAPSGDTPFYDEGNHPDGKSDKVSADETGTCGLVGHT